MFDQDAVTVIRRYLNSALRCLPDGETLTASGLESARDATKTAATLLDASHKLVAAAIYKVMDPPIRIELPPPGEALFDGLNPAPAALVKTEDPHRHPLQRLFNFLLDEFLNQYWPESDCLLNESVQSERDASEANWTRRFDNDFDSGRESVIGELHHEFSEMNELPDFENETGIDLQLEFQRACELLGRAMRAGHQAEEDIEEAMTSWRESWDRAPEDREENFRNLINLIAIEVEELEEEASDTPPEITWENGPSLPIETVTAFPPPDSTTQPGTRVYVDLDGTAIAMPADGSEGGAV